MTQIVPDEGFTVLEVVVAFAILSVTIVAFQQNSASSYRALAKSKQKEDAAVFALSQINEMRALPKEQWKTEGQVENSFTWKVRRQPKTAQAGVQWIELTIQDATGRSIVELKTAITERAAKK